MKAYLPLLACLVSGALRAQQRSTTSSSQAAFTDDNGQRIAFELPRGWQFEGGVISNARGRKVGEFTPGTVPACSYKSGLDYVKELRAGYPDDMGSPRFVGSRTLLIGPTTWTEGVRNIPAWDGRANAGRWYSHSFFAFLSKRCFVITFYSQQRQLVNEADYQRILGSIKLLP